MFHIHQTNLLELVRRLSSSSIHHLTKCLIQLQTFLLDLKAVERDQGAQSCLPGISPKAFLNGDTKGFLDIIYLGSCANQIKPLLFLNLLLKKVTSQATYYSILFLNIQRKVCFNILYTSQQEMESVATVKTHKKFQCTTWSVTYITDCRIRNPCK